MNQNSNIIDQIDSLVSHLVKTRDPHCRIRLKICTGQTVDPAHVFGRANMGTRFDIACVYGACRECHSYIDTHPNVKETVFEDIMGKKLYREMEVRAYSTIKFLPADLREIKKHLKQQI